MGCTELIGKYYKIWAVLEPIECSRVSRKKTPTNHRVILARNNGGMSENKK
jgi:hypothetical protein